MPSTVFIVDDEKNIRRTVRMVLEGEGYSVEEASSGEEALARIAEIGADVVLLDVQLPDVDGFRVAEALNDDPPSPAVVLVSSRSGGDYGSRLTSSPARGFIPKADLSGEGLQRVLDGVAS